MIWGAFSLVLAAGWVVGEWLNWTRYVYVAHAVGFTFRATGKNVVSTYCCVAFKGYSTSQNLSQALLMALVLIASLVVAFSIPSRAAGVALTALAVLYLANPLSGLYPIFVGHPGAIALGTPTNEVASGRITVTLSALPGVWIATAAGFGLLCLGIFRILASFAGSAPDAPRWNSSV
ncbi:MAG: hypothetical protein WCF24_12445 [Acidimicrobiales bacterium]